MGRHHTEPAMWRELWDRWQVVVKVTASAVVPLAIGATVALMVLGGGGGDPDPDPPPPASEAAALELIQGATDAEETYLNEFQEAGINLRVIESAVAVQIARKHVAHGHLVGMREIIRDDFRERIPRLTAEQVEIAKSLVEHHFLAVTGERQ